jgi:hypothetical protein
VALALAVLRTVVLVAMLALAGRWVVGVFAGRQREDNFVYRLLSLVASPAMRITRWLLPRTTAASRLPALCALFALAAYLALGLWHRDVCLRDLSQAGCEKWAAARARSDR